MAELPQTNPPADLAEPSYPAAAPAHGDPAGRVPGFAPPPTQAMPSFAPPAAPFSAPAPSAFQPAAMAYPVPGQPVGGNGAAVATQTDEVSEKVVRGLLFSLGGVVIGMVLAAVVWQLGFVAALTSLVMAYSCIWLYTRGAGRSPRKGAMPLVLVIMFGVFASLLAVFGSDAVQVAMKIYPGDTGAQLAWVVEFLTTPEVWKEQTGAVVMYLIFAGLGSFSIFTGLAKSRGAE
jgi:hypothetical protein